MVRRLLAQHRLAVLETGQQLLLVRRSWGGEHDGVDVRIGDGVEWVDDGAAAGDACGDLLGLLGDVIVDDGDSGTRDPGGQPRDVVRAHHTDPEDGYTQVGHGFSSLLVIS